MLDFTVRDIVEIALIGGGWVATIVKIDSRLKSVEKDIREVISLTKWRERMEERVLNLRRDVDDMRRGRGVVVGEYDRDGAAPRAD
jgi:hypothetical protein